MYIYLIVIHVYKHKLLYTVANLLILIPK